VAAVVRHSEILVEVKEANGDVELHRGRPRVLVGAEPPCVEEVDREVGWVRVCHNPTYTNARTNYDANKQREETNVGQRAASHPMEQHY
jgi:hypothetical protein